MGIEHNEPLTMEIHEKLKELQDQYNYHPPTEQRAVAHDRVRNQLLAAAQVVAYVVPKSREQALALTKIEEAMFWANAGIARTKGE